MKLTYETEKQVKRHRRNMEILSWIAFIILILGVYKSISSIYKFIECLQISIFSDIICPILLLIIGVLVASFVIEED